MLKETQRGFTRSVVVSTPLSVFSQKSGARSNTVRTRRVQETPSQFVPGCPLHPVLPQGRAEPPSVAAATEGSKFKSTPLPLGGEGNKFDSAFSLWA
jgi:hypothetical protein